MNSDLIGLLYVLGTILFWGVIISLIITFFRFVNNINNYHKEELHKLDEIIRLLKEKD